MAVDPEASMLGLELAPPLSSAIAFSASCNVAWMSGASTTTLSNSSSSVSCNLPSGMGASKTVGPPCPSKYADNFWLLVDDFWTSSSTSSSSETPSTAQSQPPSPPQRVGHRSERTSGLRASLNPRARM
eukprot:CAMPEP_0177563522 /NCGR_PEP_ID=MMETSP0369-20130122/73108_1 /TAXON_ID=447022 ORGANISM="Scrippsiella hangoei-like, Strain SHHI-4" /NCGR_SAMPLE_ID=MMETSP0369 /ASSEMBLY_ACC=CAM_ASM_000364 /LENGTH=128 /DNA_ID=CAMNT_0019050711 /DNA_START=574 /DNA_END=960 /DNA_ORIENTATION=+